MTHNSKISILYSLGVHIGNYYFYRNYLSEVHYFLKCIRHEFFIFDLNISIFFLKRAIYYISLVSLSFGKLLFYHSTINNMYNLKFIMSYIVVSKGNCSFLNTKWLPGLVTNYKIIFKNLLETFLSLKKKKSNKIKKLNELIFFSKTNLFLRYIFLKLIYMTYKKSKLRRDWATEFHKLWLFWRIYIFFKSYKYLFNLPDTLVLVNPSENFHNLLEFSKNNKLPVISTMDTSNSWIGITYPIPSNDDSIPLSFFFFSIFTNVYVNSRIRKYSKFKYIK